MRTAAILLGLLSWLMGHGRQRYAQQVKGEVAGCEQRLSDYRDNPPKHTSAEDDDAYIKRGEADISQLEQALTLYRVGKYPQQFIDMLLRKLERDVQDAPIFSDYRYRG